MVSAGHGAGPDTQMDEAAVVRAVRATITSANEVAPAAGHAVDMVTHHGRTAGAVTEHRNGSADAALAVVTATGGARAVVAAVGGAAVQADPARAASVARGVGLTTGL